MRIYLAAVLISVVSLATSVAHAELDYRALQADWAKAFYELPEDQQKDYFTELLARADQAMKDNPDSAEVYIWAGIIYSSYAKVAGGMSALKYVKQGKNYLEKAQEINDQALNGSVYVTLGSLYYKVPGWPIGFGDDKKAEKMLKKALALNPTGIDPNYFYADFLYSDGEYSEALEYAHRAEQAPARPNRPVADKGRRQELAELMAKIQEKLQ